MSGNTEEKYDVMASSERAAALSSETSVFLNVAKFEQMQRVAIMLSKSDFVPSRFRGNVGNCMIALDMAALMNMHVLMLMRTMYVVHGEPGFEGKFVSALINNSGRYTDPLEYEWRGKKGQPEWGCRAFATRKSTKKTVYGPWVDLKMVHDEKWHLPKGSQVSKWVTMPEIMFMYRAASFFGKTNDSDLLMGMQTVDELEDISADLTRRPDGKYAMTSTSSEKQTVSYEATAQAPAEKSKIVDFKQTATPPPTQDAPQEHSESAVDEFGTPVDSPFEKSKWFHARKGSKTDGTGFHSYVEYNLAHLPKVSDATYNALCDKYRKVYDGEDFPWSPHGHAADIVPGKGPVDPEIPEGVDDDQAPPPPETEPLPDLPPATETETETPLLETEAARTLAGLAGKHKREYLMVVKGRTPETIEQIFEWIEAINQLVVDHAQQSPQSDPWQEKF